MNRRQMLAAGAALPAAALPLPAFAITTNATDAAWHALIAADADHKAADDALAAAEDAVWTEPPEPPTVALPPLTGAEPRRLTLAELRNARSNGRLFLPPDDGTMERTLREALDRGLKLRQMRTPKAIAERAALYERLEAELVEQEAAGRRSPQACASARPS